MGKIVSFSNQKGGVGKTTSCVNIAAQVAKKDKKVLLIDMDPQGNATSGLGVPKSKVKKTVYDVIIGRSEANEAIIKTNFKNLWVIPANMNLAGAELELNELEEVTDYLKSELETVKSDYDYIFIDCPPSLGLLPLNAFAAADSLLVPLQCEYFAMEGVADLTTTIKMCQKRLNGALEIEGILLTMYDSRLNFSSQVSAELRRYFGDKVYDSVIPRNVRLAEAPSHGRPITEYDRHSKGARAYIAAAEEFLKRQEGN
jgi:chromosome partitioning protein